MSATRRASSLQPVGFLDDDPHALARAIRERVRSLATYKRGRCLVAIRGDRVFAAADTTQFALAIPAAAIVGLYTKTATAAEIADDLRAWIGPLNAANDAATTQRRTA